VKRRGENMNNVHNTHEANDIEPEMQKEQLIQHNNYCHQLIGVLYFKSHNVQTERIIYNGL